MYEQLLHRKRSPSSIFSTWIQRRTEIFILNFTIDIKVYFNSSSQCSSLKLLRHCASLVPPGCSTFQGELSRSDWGVKQRRTKRSVYRPRGVNREPVIPTERSDEGSQKRDYRDSSSLRSSEWQNFSFVIDEFCNNRSHEAWAKLMPGGLRKAKRVNDRANIKWQNFSFVIGGFISGGSHAVWAKLMPCGPQKGGIVKGSKKRKQEIPPHFNRHRQNANFSMTCYIDFTLLYNI